MTDEEIRVPKESNMNRRRMIIAAIIGAAVLGTAAVVGLAAHYATPRVDDDDD
jgi:hypothetical protein